jgi:hypothetical protein
MITFLSIIALIGLLVFVIGGIMWFTSRGTDTATGVATTAAARVRQAVLLMVSGALVWAVITIILGIIALVDAWT